MRDASSRDDASALWHLQDERTSPRARAGDPEAARPMHIRWHHPFLQPPSGQACIAPTRSAVARQIEKVMPALRGNVTPDALMFLRTGTPGELQVNVHGFGMFGIVSR